jgi:hypothetical protein
MEGSHMTKNTASGVLHSTKLEKNAKGQTLYLIGPIHEFQRKEKMKKRGKKVSKKMYCCEYDVNIFPQSLHEEEKRF